jgi:histidinol-phosphate aminotransferase
LNKITLQCDIVSLAAPGVRQLHPYLPGKPISELEREYGVTDIIKLASNENPLGVSPLALAAMHSELANSALYPDGNGFYLKQALARHLDVDSTQITLGNGSNDVLVLLAEAFLTPADNAVYSQYCFAVYPIAVQAASAKGKVAPALPADHVMPLGHDLEAMADLIDGQTRLVFIANPNNPTGTWLDSGALEDFVNSVPPETIVVIDEAYLEYAGSGQAANAITWLTKYPNLAITRTFSKAYGLAGIRVGYAVTSPDIADVLGRVRQPFNVNSVALAGAEAALADQDFIERSRSSNTAGLLQLNRGFNNLNFATVPSAGNFLLADMGRDPMPIYEALLKAGIIVRPVGNYGLDTYLRITVGTGEQNDTLLRALAEIVA